MLWWLICPINWEARSYLLKLAILYCVELQKGYARFLLELVLLKVQTPARLLFLGPSLRVIAFLRIMGPFAKVESPYIVKAYALL
jgi:hypothetical protein